MASPAPGLPRKGSFIIESGALLSSHTTFRIGGPCQDMVHCGTPEELLSAVRDCARKALPFLLIGDGSNIVVSDRGLPCRIIRYVSETPIIERRGRLVTVAGSTRLDVLARFCVEHGLSGLNFATGIPGTVGGAVVGNAGAYGRQVGDVLESVVLLAPDGRRKRVAGADLGFRYRHSRLKDKPGIVAAAVFRLEPGDPAAMAGERTDILRERARKHPDPTVFPSAGSFFRNIEATSAAGRRQAAGRFLEEAGAKSLRVGGAAVFEKHANIIINTGSATAQEVYDLARSLQKRVHDRFGLNLAREVRFAGRIDASEPVREAGFW